MPARSLATGSLSRGRYPALNVVAADSLGEANEGVVTLYVYLDGSPVPLLEEHERAS